MYLNDQIYIMTRCLILKPLYVCTKHFAWKRRSTSHVTERHHDVTDKQHIRSHVTDRHHDKSQSQAISLADKLYNHCHRQISWHKSCHCEISVIQFLSKSLFHAFSRHVTKVLSQVWSLHHITGFSSYISLHKTKYLADVKNDVFWFLKMTVNNCHS